MGGHGGGAGTAGHGAGCTLVDAGWAAGPGANPIEPASDPAFSSSEFQRIELMQRRYGFCPEDTRIARATLVRMDDGTARMEGARVFQTQPRVCEEQEFAPVSLSACDVRALEALIEAVPATRQCVTGNGACDPSVIASLRIDQEQVEWSLCCQVDGLIEYTASFLAIVDAIEQLAP